MSTWLWVLPAFFLGLSLLLRTKWFQLFLFRLRYGKNKAAIAGFFSDLRSWRDRYDSPAGKLERAREAVQILRAGHWVNRGGSIVYLRHDHIEDYLGTITEALETGSSYRRMRTTKEEVIGFRSGEAHKASARLQLELLRRFERHWYSIWGDNVVRLAETGGFALEEIGTSRAELEALDRERSRQTCQWFVDHFRSLVLESASHVDDADEMEGRLKQWTDPAGDYCFTYEDLGTTEKECSDLMYRARLHKIQQSIVWIRERAMEGTLSQFWIGNLKKQVQEIGLTLKDFDLTEPELDGLMRASSKQSALMALESLRTPDEKWFGAIEIKPGVTWFLELSHLEESLGLPGDPEKVVDRIRCNIEEAGCVLADIGTSEEELSELVRKGCLFAASFLLERLRYRASTPRESRLQATAAMLPEGARLPLMTSQEVAELQKPVDPPPFAKYVSIIRCYLEKAGGTLGDIGSSEEEIVQLESAIYVG